MSRSLSNLLLYFAIAYRSVPVSVTPFSIPLVSKEDILLSILKIILPIGNFSYSFAKK